MKNSKGFLCLGLALVVLTTGCQWAATKLPTATQLLVDGDASDGDSTDGDEEAAHESAGECGAVGWSCDAGGRVYCATDGSTTTEACPEGTTCTGDGVCTPVTDGDLPT